MDHVTRSGFLRGAAAGGAAVAAGGALGLLAGTASAATSESDLAWLRFAITAEAVSVAYYAAARRAGGWTGDEARALERATAAQVAHRNAFRKKLVDLGESPIGPADLEVEVPDKAFETRAGTVALGRRIQALAVHAYLGALTTVSDSDIRRLFAQTSASESEQLCYLTGLTGRVLTDPFPPVHGIATAAEELAAFLP